MLLTATSIDWNGDGDSSGISTNWRPWTEHREGRLSKDQRLKTPRRVATSLKPTSCWPPQKASVAMEISIFIYLQS